MKKRILIVGFLALILAFGCIGLASAELTAYVAGTQRTSITAYVQKGYQAEIAVDAATSDGGDLTYVWQYYSYDEATGEYTNGIVEGAAGPSLETDPINHYTEYYCYVSDGNTSRGVFFYFRIENQMTACVKGSQNEHQVSMTVLPGGLATFEVEASCANGPLTYVWKGQVVNEDGTTNFAVIEGADTATLSVDSINAYTQYYCHVTDQYLNAEDIWFSVSIDNQFSAWVDGYKPETSHDYGVAPNSTVLMAVGAQSSAGTYTYRWHYEMQRDDGSWMNVQIEGADGPSLTSEPVTGPIRYWCLVTDAYRNTKSVSFYLYIDNQLQAQVKSPASNTVYIPIGSTALMEVEASCAYGELSYQWYRSGERDGSWFEEIVEGETGASMTSAPLTGYSQYYCRVTDTYQNERNVYFYLRVDNQLKIWAKGAEPGRSQHFYVAPNSTVLMEVEASCDDGPITYQWYRDHGGYSDPIEGATGTSYTSEPVTEYSWYWCRATDEYLNSQDVSFHLSVDNELTAWAKGTNHNDSLTLALQPGGTAVMEVEAAWDAGGITYQWYQAVKENDGWHDEKLEGETGASLTAADVQAYSRYWCVVTDDYQNTKTVWFYLKIDNQLQAWIKDEESNTFYVTPGNTVFMEVEASCLQGGLSYQWYCADENGEAALEGETGASMTSAPVTNGIQYYCRVTDIYQNSTSVSFYLRIDNQLKIWAKGAEPGYSQDFYVAPESTVFMEVEASCFDGPITYQWYRSTRRDGDWYSDPIEGATGTSCTSAPVTEYSWYWCRATDKYQNNADVSFHLHIDNQLKAWVKGNSEQNVAKLSVAPESTVLMEVEASCQTGAMSYQWYKFEITDQFKGWAAVEGATGASLESVQITQEASYLCDVTDAYQNTAEVRFSIRVDNQLKAWAKDYQNKLYAAPGATVLMEVEYSCASGPVSYRWSKLVEMENGNSYWQAVEGATEASFASDPVTAYAEYLCEVIDQYNNSVSVWFSVGIDNQLKAWAKDYQNKLYAAPGATVLMEVEYSCASGPVSYRWSKLVEMENGNSYWQAVEGATEASFASDPVTAYTEYLCEVIDQYNNSASVGFSVRVDNQLNAWAKDYQNKLYAAPGATVLMKVEYSCTQGPVSYRWSKLVEMENGNRYWQAVEGATEASLASDPVTAYAEYLCEVIDQYNNSVSVWFNVGIDNQLTAWAKGTNHLNYEDLTLQPGGSALLEVEAEWSAGEVSYQWYKMVSQGNDWYPEPIEGETSASFTAANVERYTEYWCKVTDNYQNAETVYFYLHIDNQLTVWAKNDQYKLYAAPGGTVDMEVLYSCAFGTVTFRWFKLVDTSDGKTWQVIEGATGASLTSDPVTAYAEYRCEVKDVYDNTISLRFEVGIENQLTAWVSGQDPNRNWMEYYTEKGGTVVMQAEASCAKGEMTYQWYRRIQIEDGWYYREAIQGATELSLTSDPVTEYARYYFEAKDSYGNTAEVDFTLHINNQLTAWVKDHKPQNNWSYTVAPNGTMLMEVEAECTEGEMTYQWYRRVKNAYGWYMEEIVGATEASFTSDPVTEFIEYECEVKDKYQNSVYVYFHLYMDNQLNAWIKDYKPNSCTVEYEGSVVLEVEASCQMGEKHYQWYQSVRINNQWNDIPIDGATSPSLTVGPVTQSSQYYCRVTDDYNNSRNVWFYLYINNDLSIEPLTETMFRIQPGQEIEMAVSAACNDGDITYQWYTGFNRTLIENATSSAYTCAPNDSRSFVCEAKDQYGNTASVTFECIVGDIPAIQPGSYTATIPSAGAYVYYSFTPTVTGDYVIQSSANDADPWLTLLNASFKEMAGNDDDAGNLNFYLCRRLNAGVTYYFGITCYGADTGLVPFTLSLDKEAEGGNTVSIVLRAGQTVVLPGADSSGAQTQDTDVVSCNGTQITALAAGTATVTTTYVQYNVTVVANAPVIKLPSGTEYVDESAFEGDDSVVFVELNSGLYGLYENAFCDSGLRQIVVNGGDTWFYYSAFDGTNPTVVCHPGSRAENLAFDLGFAYVYIP